MLQKLCTTTSIRSSVRHRSLTQLPCRLCSSGVQSPCWGVRQPEHYDRFFNILDPVFEATLEHTEEHEQLTDIKDSYRNTLAHHLSWCSDEDFRVPCYQYHRFQQENLGGWRFHRIPEVFTQGGYAACERPL